MGTATISPTPLVLLADADSDTRDLLSCVLGSQHYDVAEAVDGPDLVETAGRLHPAIILTELILPRLDGFEAAQRLKADPATAAIPIIALTGYTPKTLTEDARRAGIEQVFLKPTAPDVLVAAVQRVLAQSRATRQEHGEARAIAQRTRQQASENCAQTRAAVQRAQQLMERAREIVARKPSK